MCAFRLTVATVGVILPVVAFAQPPIPTFSRDVAPIFHRHCVSCHRPGQNVPMSLVTYKDARPWSRSIRARVAARTMPPWFAEDGHRQLVDRRLNDNELMTVLAWVDGGAPEGQPLDRPLRSAVEAEWQIGSPDAIFEMPVEVAIPRTGTLGVQRVVVQTGFTTERWVEAIEIRPSDPAHVHQAVARVQDREPLSSADGEWPLSGDVLAMYASGVDPLILPHGTALRLPAGAAIVFEVHYVTNGIASSDRTRLALRFAREAPSQEVHLIAASAADLEIPQGEAYVQASVPIAIGPLPQPVRVLRVMPHAHRRAKSFEYRLRGADGRLETILRVPRFNWLWQTAYEFADPIVVPPTSTLELVGVYDNSAANKANPDPRQAVHTGWDPARDEMLVTLAVIVTPRREPQ